jgi:hypothetical protein
MRKAPKPRLSVLRACELARNQRSKLLVSQSCKLQHAGVQPLQLAFGHRVEVDAPNALLGVWALQPTKKNLRGTRIGDCLLAQATLNLRIRSGLAFTARCAGM